MKRKKYLRVIKFIYRGQFLIFLLFVLLLLSLLLQVIFIVIFVVSYTIIMIDGSLHVVLFLRLQISIIHYGASIQLVAGVFLLIVVAVRLKLIIHVIGKVIIIRISLIVNRAFIQFFSKVVHVKLLIHVLGSQGLLLLVPLLELASLLRGIVLAILNLSVPVSELGPLILT